MASDLASVIRGLQPLADDLAGGLGIALAISGADGRILLVAGSRSAAAQPGDGPAHDPARGRLTWEPVLAAADADTHQVLLRWRGEPVATCWWAASRTIPLDVRALTGLLERRLGELEAHQAEIDDMAAELLDSYEEINRFYELAKTLDRATSERELSELVLGKALEATGPDGGAVILLVEESPTVVAVAGDVGAPLDGRRVPAYASLRQALERGVASNVSGSPNAAADQPDRPTIVVPLPIKARPAGAMIIQRRRATPFDAGDVKIVQSMCSQAGVFLNNLRQAGRLIEAAGVRKDIELAETVQRQLLPANEIRMPGVELAAAYLATNQIGGDYYDFLRIGPGALAVIVADVSGHSIASGLLMASARSVARLLVQQGTAPDEVLGRLNEALYRGLERSGNFISLCCLVLNVETWEGRYANAGHNPPFLQSPRTTTVKTLDATGPLLGVLEEATYDRESFTMAPGDALVLYTDGISEARAEDGTMFGEERLQRLAAEAGSLDAQRTVDRIMAEVRRHAGRRLTDDVTLVVLKAGVTAPGAAADRATGSEVYEVRGALENVPKIRHWLVERLAAWKVSEAVIGDVALAVTEICTNVARHGYRGQAAGEIEVQLAREGPVIRVCVLDTAPAYAPPEHPPAPAGELAEGGYGLSLVHRVMDEVRWERRDPVGNRVVMRKTGLPP